MDDNIALRIFPSEIWLKIFKSAVPEVINKIYHCSPFFGSLVHPYRTRLLFSSVLPTVVTYLPNNKSTTKILQNCRLVCRFWNKSVTRYVQDQMKNFAADSGVPVYFPSYLDPFCSEFYDNSEKVTTFTKHFDVSHLSVNKNPFVSRHIRLNYEYPEVLAKNYFAKLQQVLSKFGHHVRYCHVSVIATNCNGDYSQIRQILDLLPNLKGVTVYLLKPMLTLRLDMQNTRPVRIPPFPNYPKLECLRVGGATSEYLFQALLSNNRQVKLMERNCWNYEGDEFIYSEAMPNLQHMKLTLYNMNDFERLSNLQNIWHLKRLNIDLRFIEDPVSWQEMGKCFKLLEQKFGNTLESLTILFPEEMTHFNHSSCKLSLPTLTSLTLQMTSAYLLDFLLPMRNNLKILNVVIETVLLSGMRENAVKFYSAVNDLRRSNIWSMFPKLEEITFACLKEDSIKRKYKRSEIP